MEKYYWNPTREDRIGVCFGIFKDDGLDRGQIEYLVDTFPAQSIDFFGALRSRVYDNAVREFIEEKGLDNLAKGVLVSTREKFEFDTPRMDLVRPAACSLFTPPPFRVLAIAPAGLPVDRDAACGGAARMRPCVWRRTRIAITPQLPCRGRWDVTRCHSKFERSSMDGGAGGRRSPMCYDTHALI